MLIKLIEMLNIFKKELDSYSIMYLSYLIINNCSILSKLKLYFIKLNYRLCLKEDPNLKLKISINIQEKTLVFKKIYPKALN